MNHNLPRFCCREGAFRPLLTPNPLHTLVVHRTQAPSPRLLIKPHHQRPHNFCLRFCPQAFLNDPGVHGKISIPTDLCLSAIQPLKMARLRSVNLTRSVYVAVWIPGLLAGAIAFLRSAAVIRVIRVMASIRFDAELVCITSSKATFSC